MLFSGSRSAKPGSAGLARGWLRLGATLALASLLMFSPSAALDQARLLEAAARFNPRTLAEAQQVLQLIDKVLPLDEEARLSQVNRFFNKRIEFREDIEVWGKIDYWASPLELLDKGRGDCEDYAIAKYFSLVSAGVPVAKLRMVYVRASLGGRSVAHMVLAYYAQPGAEPLILDNLIADVRPASQRPDLQPVFSFNSEGLWQGVGATSAGDPLQRLSLWRDLLAKVQAEGF
ncbi:putative transglutaminase-like cysteine proteinase [Paucibacter oligotrophus]|uniref:Putative transglutaminase-like cysteine proteinase n=1 Tax=Roseateles oligotrophus TaxID=1769250 RepID=A0A840LFH2_9BURK|nr:transglutaminase-like cysteine peptidase [Roseateles oligotrophus]MBB4845382.1 putative transglutaminase-like cysteine proteinase [Roseateles oligotrophus]